MTIEPERILALCEMLKAWHYDNDTIRSSTDTEQFTKLIQQIVGGSEKGVEHNLGCMLSIIINIAERNNVSLTECLDAVYKDIKD